jgi:hypothetical protein
MGEAMFQNSYCRVQRQLSFYPSNSKIITYEDSATISGQQGIVAVMVKSELNILLPGTFHMPYAHVASQLIHSIGYAPEAPKHRMIIFQPTIS